MDFCKLKLPHLAQSENDMLLQSLTWVCVSHAGRFLQSVWMNSYQEASMSSMSRRHQKIGLITVCLCISSSTNCDLESDRGKVDWRTFFQTGWRFKPRTCSHLVLSPLLLLYCSSESSESLLNWRLPVYAPTGQWRLIPERKQSIAFRLCRHRRKGGEVSNM